MAPDLYAESFSTAVDFLGSQPFVDRQKIGAIGVCGSGSFVISAAKIVPRMKAIATVSMYDMGAANRDALHHSQTLAHREFYDFYRTPRGEYTPKSSTRLLTTHPTLTSNVKFMNFYPFNDIETISPRQSGHYGDGLTETNGPP